MKNCYKLFVGMFILIAFYLPNCVLLSAAPGSVQNQRSNSMERNNSVTPNAEEDFKVTKTIDGMGLIITKYDGTGTQVRIPDTIHGQPVREIGSRAFAENPTVTIVVIPEGVIKIGSDAFFLASSLTSVTIPEGVTEIGSRAFVGCGRLSSITLPTSLTNLGYGVFMNNPSLVTITIPRNLRFSNSSDMNSNDSGVNAFSGCMSITSVTISEGVIEIPNQMFSSCVSLTRVIFPSSLTAIGEFAFSGCNSLTSISLPASIKKIGHFAFERCSALTTVTIPRTVGSIEFGEHRGYSLNAYSQKGSSSFENCPLSKTTQETLKRLGYTGTFDQIGGWGTSPSTPRR